MQYNRFMRRMLFFWVLIGVVLMGEAQLWEPVGGGTNSAIRAMKVDPLKGLLYIGGGFGLAGGTFQYGIATWDGSQWGSVGVGTGDTNCIGGCNPILSIEVFQDQVFVGGQNFMMGGIQGHKFLNRWNGQQWDSCGNPSSPATPKATNGILFALGGFHEISGRATSKIAQWNGSDWDPIADSIPFGDSTASMNAAAYYQGSYYFGGNFTGDQFHEIMAKDGQNWLSLNGGIRGDSWVNKLVVYKGLLFVGGEFTNASGNASSFLTAWDGLNWLNPFQGIEYLAQVQDLQVIDGVLYIVGTHRVFDGSSWSGYYEVAKYDGVDFCSFGGTYFHAVGIAGLNGELYLSTERVVQGDTMNYFARWAGADSVDFCSYQPVRTQDPAAPAPLVTLAPNPARDHITLTLPQGSAVADFQIHDVAGRLVVPAQRYRAGEQVDVAALPAGLYFVEVRMRGRVEVLKMMKE